MFTFERWWNTKFKEATLNPAERFFIGLALLGAVGLFTSFGALLLISL